MKRKLTAGLTSVSLPIFIQSTASTTGGGLAGLTSSTSGLVAEYRRQGQSTWTAITLATATLGTWVSGGFTADGALDGAYELDLPDAVCASGVRWVAVRLRGAANMLPCLIEIELDVVNYQTIAFGANTTVPDNAGVAAIKVVTDRVNTGLVADGLVWQFTANMLELGPSGGGGGSGDAEQATLLDVQEAVDSIATALAGGSPVEPTGRIANGGRVLAYVGDDFTVRSGTALPIPVKDPAGGLYTLLTSIGVENLQFGASLAGKPAGLITGTIASVTQSGSGASQLCNITVEIANCGVGLKLSEDYEWQIQSTQTHGEATDSLIRLEGMLSLRRNVVG